MHCQRETCDLIVQEGGNYCMQLKGNQGDMQVGMQAFVAEQDIEYIDEYTSADGDHGRMGERSYPVRDVPDYLADTHQQPHPEGLVLVVSRRTVGETASHSADCTSCQHTTQPRQPPR